MVFHETKQLFRTHLISYLDIDMIEPGFTVNYLVIGK